MLNYSPFGHSVNCSHITLDPYPWAIDEGFDVYRILTETKGGIIGMNGQKLDVILSGDSA